MTVKRKASVEELEARAKHGDRSFLRWLKSAARREELAVQKQRAGNRFLVGYWRKAFSEAVGMNLVLNIGCGMGTHAAGIINVPAQGEVRYVGMDYDPECIRHCRRQYGGLPSFQFHPCDYLNPPKLPRKFDYVAVTHVLDSLPVYGDLLSHVWHRCTKGLLVLFDRPLSMGQAHHLMEDANEGRLYATFPAGKVLDFCRSMAQQVESATVYSDSSQEREHVILLQKSEDVPNLSGIHHFAENGITFPYYSEGLL